MKKLMIIVSLFLLAGCSSNTLEKELGFNNKDIKEIIQILNEDDVLRSTVSASINGTELTVTKDSESLVYDVGEEFYLAVAPYQSYTHTWTFHSVTGCRAEMVEEEFLVTFEVDGEYLVNEVITSLKNGFIELWLPRDVEGILTISINGLSATEEIGTFDDDLTCLTTMELK